MLSSLIQAILVRYWVGPGLKEWPYKICHSSVAIEHFTQRIDHTRLKTVRITSKFSWFHVCVVENCLLAQQKRQILACQYFFWCVGKSSVFPHFQCWECLIMEPPRDVALLWHFLIYKCRMALTSSEKLKELWRVQRCCTSLLRYFGAYSFSGKYCK
jgi:hypothetical protein